MAASFLAAAFLYPLCRLFVNGRFLGGRFLDGFLFGMVQDIVFHDRREGGAEFKHVGERGKDRRVRQHVEGDGEERGGKHGKAHHTQIADAENERVHDERRHTEGVERLPLFQDHKVDHEIRRDRKRRENERPRDRCFCALVFIEEKRDRAAKPDKQADHGEGLPAEEVGEDQKHDAERLVQKIQRLFADEIGRDDKNDREETGGEG